MNYLDYRKQFSMKIKIVFIFILLLLNSNPLFAENTLIKQGDNLTLDRCIDIAISKNPNINLAENTTKAYKSRIGESKAGYLPQVGLSSGYNRANPITSLNTADKDSNQYAGSITLNQLVYDFGKTPTKVKIQDLNFNSSRFDVENAVILTSYNVKQAYYSALTAKINRDIYERSITQYEQHLKQARAFYEVGTKSKIDVTTANVNLSNAKLNYIKANDSYKIAISNLNNAMGIPDAPEYNISDDLNYKDHNNSVEKNLLKITTTTNNNITNKTKLIAKKTAKPDKPALKSSVSECNIVKNLQFKKYDITFGDALKTAYANRPDLKSLIIKGDSANESVKLAKKDYFPDVTGFANYGWGGKTFPLDSGWSFGANVNLPVFNEFLTKNKIDEAKANMNIAESNVDILKQNIYLQVQQAYISLTESEKRIPITELTVMQTKESLDLANGRYKVGVGNAIEVQDAEINYNNAQLSYIQAFYDYNTARINLEKAMGVK